MLTETDIKKLVFVLCQEIKEGLISEIKVVKHVVVVVVRKKILSSEVKILNIVHRIRKKRPKRKRNRKSSKQEMVAVRIA
jgi:hypothetical protein